MDLSMSADSTDSSGPKRSRREEKEDDGDDGNNEAMCQSPVVIGSSGVSGDAHPLVREPVNTHPISSSTNGKESAQALDLSSHHHEQPPIDGPIGTSTMETEAASSIHSETTISLSQIQFKRSLNEYASRKMTIFEGTYHGTPAVVMLEKTPFTESSVQSLIGDTTSSLNRDFVNDVYGKYNMYPRTNGPLSTSSSTSESNNDINCIKTTIIHPATESHIKKYLPMKLKMVTETADNYNKITLPFIESSSFDITWVYNILEHKQESERIVFEDLDPETGFILLPDLKWYDQNNVNDLYLVAIVHRRDIKSIRDLRSQHLDLLKNIRTKGIAAIESKYQGINSSNLRIYFHYQPSYYHLHVHFTNLAFEAPGCKVERAHLLDHVISNIELMDDYYGRATLSFCERENSKLAALYH